MPRWFRDANKIWNGDLAEYLAFVAQSAEIHALFDGDDLIALVYVEEQPLPHEMSIHLSIIRAVEPAAFIKAAGELRTALLRRGIRQIRGWILRRNFALCKMLVAIGFAETELAMRFGLSHGRSLRWKLFVLRAG